MLTLIYHPVNLKNKYTMQDSAAGKIVYLIFDQSLCTDSTYYVTLFVLVREAYNSIFYSINICGF